MREEHILPEDPIGLQSPKLKYNFHSYRRCPK